DLGPEAPSVTTLRRVVALRRYPAFLWDLIRPYVGRRILEVGAGKGLMTRYLATRERLLTTDADPEVVAVLRRQYASQANINVGLLDLASLGTNGLPRDFDTVVCANVLEHVQDDGGALRGLGEVLTPGGRLVVIVPALPGLYGAIDKAIGHQRRYTRDELAQKLGAAGFAVEHIRYFNVIGVLGWWLNARL